MFKKGDLVEVIAKYSLFYGCCGTIKRTPTPGDLLEVKIGKSTLFYVPHELQLFRRKKAMIYRKG